MSVDRDRNLHNLMDFVGIRARPTAAGLLQLCAELRRAGILDVEAIERIKTAVLSELTLSLPQHRSNSDLANAARRHLDSLFEDTV